MTVHSNLGIFSAICTNRVIQGLYILGFVIFKVQYVTLEKDSRLLSLISNSSRSPPEKFFLGGKYILKEQATWRDMIQHNLADKCLFWRGPTTDFVFILMFTIQQS